MTGFRHLVAYVQNGFVFEPDQDNAIARQMRPRHREPERNWPASQTMSNASKPFQGLPVTAFIFA